MTDGRQVIVCVGNPFRSDDGVGLQIADRLRGRVPPGAEVLTLEGEPTVLLDILDSSELVILVDAVAVTGVPGAIHRFDASGEALPGSVFGASTHAFGLAETIELARALGRLNGRVLVYGITGADFGAGEGLSPSVAAAIERVIGEILQDLSEQTSPPAESKGAGRA